MLCKFYSTSLSHLLDDPKWPGDDEMQGPQRAATNRVAFVTKVPLWSLYASRVAQSLEARKVHTHTCPNEVCSGGRAVFSATLLCCLHPCREGWLAVRQARRRCMADPPRWAGKHWHAWAPFRSCDCAYSCVRCELEIPDVPTRCCSMCQMSCAGGAGR